MPPCKVVFWQGFVLACRNHVLVVPSMFSYFHALMFPMGWGPGDCQGITMFWDGAANCHVFSPTMASFCPDVFGVAAGTMNETKHYEQGSQWGLQAGLNRGWNGAFPNVCQLQEWSSSMAKKPLSTFPAELTPPLATAV